MRKTSIWIIAAAWIVFAFTPGAMAEPVDPTKSLRTGVEKVIQTRQGATEFQFGNFTVRSGQDGVSKSWNVDLSITQPIRGNRWLVKTVFQDRAGSDLFSGEDILLPAGHAGKVYRLTRSFQDDPRMSTIVFHVYNQAEDRIAATQAYSVAPEPSYGAMGAAASAVPSVPGKGSSVAAKIDTALDVAFVPEPSHHSRFRIKNNSAFTVRINEISATARFRTGAKSKISANCSPKEIKPGESSSCEIFSPTECPTLTAIDIKALLNGIAYHHQVHYDAPIKPIDPDKPLLRLEKNYTRSGLLWGSTGTATIIIRGAYVRIGARLTMKALASVDSDLFPVVFDGWQRDDGIHAKITIRGKGVSKPPDRFCFNLMEITTCDSLGCGGVGVLLYRNTYDQSKTSPSETMNIFLESRMCE